MGWVALKSLFGSRVTTFPPCVTTFSPCGLKLKKSFVVVVGVVFSVDVVVVVVVVVGRHPPDTVSTPCPHRVETV